MNLIRVDLPEPAFPFLQYGNLTISRRHRRSYSITTPSKRNSSATSHFALSRCRQSYGTTNPSKRNSSATSYFALGRCEQSCGTTNLSKRNSDPAPLLGSAVVPRIVVQQTLWDQPLGRAFLLQNRWWNQSLWLELPWNQTRTFISPLQEDRGPCLEEGSVLGPISRSWFWSFWGLFWCPCDAFRKSNSHSYSPLSLFLLASLWGLIVDQKGIEEH